MTRTIRYLQTITIPYGIVYWLIFSLGLCWMCFIAAQSDGTAFLDEIHHFTYSRNAWHYPELILSRWGRPVNTLIYMVPALGDLGTARALSILMSATTVIVATEIAKGLGVKQLALIPLCLWFQPWFVDIGYSANTMVPLSLALVSGIYLWQKDEYFWASATFSLMPLIRHETIAIIGLWFIYMAYKRQILPTVVTVAPMILWNIAFLLTFGEFASANLVSGGVDSNPYGSGPWIYYLPHIFVGVFPFVLLLSLFAVMPIANDPNKRQYFYPYIVYLSVHVVVYRFGIFSSGGYGFFLMPLAPAFAIMAAIGLERFQLDLRIQAQRKKKLRAYRLIMGLIVAGIIVSGLWVSPRKMHSDAQDLKAASDWLDESHPDSNVTGIHPWFIYLHDVPWIPDETHTWDEARFDNADVGNIMVWDPAWSPRMGFFFDYFADETNGWVEVNTFGNTFIFQKNGESIN